MSPPADKANLVRIRDNQRRSRARRKEYLQELEQRLRIYELQGVEASAEIQQAARRVVNENKKLRAMLNEHGVGDAEINSYLQSTDTPGQMSTHDATVTEDSAGQTLERLLIPRRPCLDSNPSSLLPKMDGQKHRRSKSLGTLALGPPGSGSFLTSTGETFSSVVAQSYEQRMSLDEDQLVRQSLSVLNPAERQGLDMYTMSSNPTNHHADQIDKTQTHAPGIWAEAPQISAGSAASLQATSMPTENSYYRHAAHIVPDHTQHFSTPWLTDFSTGSKVNGMPHEPNMSPLTESTRQHFDGYMEFGVNNESQMDKFNVTKMGL
ncbi:hypothetical protein BX600DRAFT_446312 [Xylariales sp. PMI_506]|nr:hypothetical protein BX600DRAFT_446312 [Xylariales sp. PMI_506]